MTQFRLYAHIFRICLAKPYWHMVQVIDITLIWFDTIDMFGIIHNLIQ